MKRLPVFLSFVFFVALCISATFWAMRLFKPSVRPVVAPQPIARLELNMAAAASLFGGRPASVAVASNYQLKGVVVADNPEGSVAILSTDGKPPQSIAINAEVSPGVTVKEVHAKYVLLLDGGITKRVELVEASQQLRVESVNNESVSQPAAVPSMSPMTAPPSIMPPPQPGMPQGIMPMPRPQGVERNQ